MCALEMMIKSEARPSHNLLPVSFLQNKKRRYANRKKIAKNYLPGHFLQRLPFLYFLQHFFLTFFPCAIGNANGSCTAVGS